MNSASLTLESVQNALNTMNNLRMEDELLAHNPIMIVPPALEETADRIHNTSTTLLKEIGNYKKYRDVYKGKFSDYKEEVKVM